MNLTRSRQFEIRSIESGVRIREGFAVGGEVGAVVVGVNLTSGAGGKVGAVVGQWYSEYKWKFK